MGESLDRCSLVWTHDGHATQYARVVLRQEEVRVGAIAATLSLPAGPGPFPAVVMTHGSDPQPREEFQAFAAYCELLGIAVIAGKGQTPPAGSFADILTTVRASGPGCFDPRPSLAIHATHSLFDLPSGLNSDIPKTRGFGAGFFSGIGDWLRSRSIVVGVVVS